MRENTLAVVLAVSTVAGMLGVAAVITALWYRARYKATGSWRHVGTPPAGIDVALQVLRGLCPGMPWGGTLTWVDQPWVIGYGGPGKPMLAAGQILDPYLQVVKLQRLPEVWRTALAHELHHLWRHATTGDRDEIEDEAFRRWVADANSQIAAALG